MPLRGVRHKLDDQPGTKWVVGVAIRCEDGGEGMAHVEHTVLGGYDPYSFG